MEWCAGPETITNNGFIGSGCSSVYTEAPHAGADKSLDISRVPHTYVSNIFFSFSVRFGKQAVNTDKSKMKFRVKIWQLKVPHTMLAYQGVSGGTYGPDVSTRLPGPLSTCFITLMLYDRHFFSFL